VTEHPVPATVPWALPRPAAAAPAADLPAIADLFRFMRDAERRFETLRMQIVDRTVVVGRTVASAPEGDTSVDVWLRHPGAAKVVTRAAGGPVNAGFDTWLSDGVTVQRYDARARVIRVRPLGSPPDGTDDPDLPAFARVYRPRTQLPAGSLADTFIHPHGFCRNVLSTGAMRFDGVREVAGGREALVLRCDHPRTTKVLTDRPDHWIDVAVDRVTGAILGLVEHVGDRVTRDAEALSFEPDAPVSDADFQLHVSAGVRRLY
jgi:hypothetical protein